MYRIYISLLLVVLTFDRTYGQLTNRFVFFQQRFQCQFFSCGFGSTCDLGYQTCWDPPCPKTVRCVPNVFMSRSGTCPSPNEDRQRLYPIECFTDAGCFATQRCCHTFSGSYCYTPQVVIG